MQLNSYHISQPVVSIDLPFYEEFDLRRLFLEILQQIYKKNAIFLSHINLLGALVTHCISRLVMSSFAIRTIAPRGKLRPG